MIGDPDAFWHQTPRTLALALEGANRRLLREDRGRRMIAWYAAAPQAGKSFPTLAEFLGDKPQAPPMDVEDSMSIWCAVMASAAPA